MSRQRTATNLKPEVPASATLHLEREAGQHVAYRAEGAGPAILLLHGMGTTAESYETLTATLVGRGYHVLRPDLRGHGM